MQLAGRLMLAWNCLGDDSAHSGLSSPISINNQDNPLQTCPQANYFLDNP